MLVIALVTVAHAAAAERAVTVEVTTPALRADQVERAIRVRVPADGAPVHVRVTPTATGLVVEARGGTREVDITGLAPDAATRLVALTASDLLLDDLAMPPPLPVVRALSVAVVGGAAGWEQPMGSVTGDLAIVRGRRLVAAELGIATLSRPVQLETATARLTVGLRAGVFEVRTGVTLAPLFVGDGAGDRTVLVGAGASVRARLPISARVRGVFALGTDVFATQTVYRAGGMTVLTTPRVAPYFAAGLELTP